MNESRSWPQDSMNNSRLWMTWKASGSWAQGSTSYEQLKVVDDMNDLEFRELGPLDLMNWSGLGKIWMILCHELKPLDAMNCSMLWMTWTTSGHELKARDAINNSGLWLTWIILGHELRGLGSMNCLRLLMTWTTPGRESQGSRCYDQLEIVVDKNQSESRS